MSCWDCGEDLCMQVFLYLEKKIGFMSMIRRGFGNIKLEILYNPRQLIVFLFWMNVLFFCFELYVGSTSEKHAFIGEHFYCLLFCQLFYTLQVMTNPPLDLLILTRCYLSVQHRRVIDATKCWTKVKSTLNSYC